MVLRVIQTLPFTLWIYFGTHAAQEKHCGGRFRDLGDCKPHRVAHFLQLLHPIFGSFVLIFKVFDLLYDSYIPSWPFRDLISLL